MISIIAAVGDNNVLGKNNRLLWHLPADLRRFKRLTMGYPVIMGRKTFESLGRPLSGRENIVISRNASFRPESVRVFNSLEEALKAYQDRSVFIIGGAEIYRQVIDRADRIYLTRIFHRFEGDAFFPTIDEQFWKVEKMEVHEPDEKNPYRYAFIDYVRKLAD
jgi:dihydrofolate reductase